MVLLGFFLKKYHENFNDHFSMWMGRDWHHWVQIQIQFQNGCLDVSAVYPSLFLVVGDVIRVVGPATTISVVPFLIFIKPDRSLLFGGTMELLGAKWSQLNAFLPDFFLCWRGSVL